MAARAESDLERVRTEASAHYAVLREENSELRAANSRLAEGLEARQRETSTTMHATLDERNRTVAAIEAKLGALQAEHDRQRVGVAATLEERNAAVATLEAQLGAVQAQLVTVLQAQLQQRDAVRKMTASSSLQAPPLSVEEFEPQLTSPILHASSSRIIGRVDQLVFGDASEHRESLSKKRLSQPKRSVHAEFASNEGGMWLREYEYVAQQPARQRRHQRGVWQVDAPTSSMDDEIFSDGNGGNAAAAASFDIVVRDEGHDGWTLDDFCSRPLARAAGLTKAEVAVLRLFTGPCHAPLQFFLRAISQGDALVQASGANNATDGGAALSNVEVLSCTGRPYYVHFGGERRSPEPFLFVADNAHRAATGAERCVRCRRPRREHSRQRVHDWSTTCGVLCSAIEKLAMWSPPMTAYRPIREEEGNLPPAFVPQPAEPARCVPCADRGVLCATTDRQVALGFSGGAAAHASLLEIGFDYSSHGASLQWLSQYPRECEVAYLPCTSLLPQGAIKWSERRKVISVHATPTSLRTRTDAITTLETDPSGAVHAIATAVSGLSAGVSGLSAEAIALGGRLGVGNSVAKLWKQPQPAQSAQPQQPTAKPLSDAQAASSTSAAQPTAPRSAMQEELTGELKERMRNKVASSRSELVIATRAAFSTEGGAAATGTGGGAAAAKPAIKQMSYGDGVASGAQPSAAQRKAVLTLNDALELLEENSKPPPPREKGVAETRVQKHLDAAMGHLNTAALLEGDRKQEPAKPVVKKKPVGQPVKGGRRVKKLV